MRLGSRHCALAAVALWALVAPAGAEGFSSPVLRAELVDGWQTAAGTEMAALHLVLAPGWKTYWRAPGEAGIPPRFDWSGSENLAAVAFHWPRPEIFDLNGFRTFGYHDELVLPIELTPRDRSLPIRVRAEVDIGVCDDICVPMSLDLSGELAPGGSAVAAIRRALADAPERAAAAGLSAAHCDAEPIRDGMRLTSRLMLPSVGPDEQAVFELSDQTVWISPADTRRDGAELRATADLVPATARPFAVNRSDIRITIFGGTGRVVELQGCAG